MRVLAFFAHPDDETMIIGGTLTLLANQGADVHYLCATRGEGGEMGEPPVTVRDQLGAVREQEMICAVKALGGKSLEFLDYVDPLVGPGDELYAFSAETAEIIAKLYAVMVDLQIEVLITHGSGGEYGHPAHRLVYQATKELIGQLGDRAPLWYTVHAAFAEHPRPTSMNKDDPAHLVIDASAVLEQKVQAALCHRSQHALFVRRKSQELGRLMTVPEVILPLESLHRAWPVVNGRVNDPMANLLIGTGAASAVLQK